MIARAAETAGEAAAHAEPFWASAEFWVLVAFLIFVGLAARPAWRNVTRILDERAGAIRADIEEAQKLREEAQKMLAEAERKQRDAVKHSGEIVTAAREQAGRLGRELGEQLERSLKTRARHAEERIEQAEAQAVAEVRAAAADIALETTRRLIAENLSEDERKALIDKSIGEIPDKLH